MLAEGPALVLVQSYQSMQIHSTPYWLHAFPLLEHDQHCAMLSVATASLTQYKESLSDAARASKGQG